MKRWDDLPEHNGSPRGSGGEQQDGEADEKRSRLGVDATGEDEPGPGTKPPR